MGLEVSTYIGGLTPSWPLAGDLKSQGDDHIRLLKSVLQNTFPNGTKPFYFPSAEAIAGTQTLDITDMNNTQLITTTGGNVAVTLPTLTTTDKGWKIDIIKVTSDTNAVIVSPASGTIASKCGATATIRVGIFAEPATFLWTGGGWICSKPGPMIGSTENFDGVTVPPGYLLDDGSAFSNTAFAELFAVLGSSTLRDKRGRTEIGVDSGAVNMNATDYGTSPVLGATKAGSSKSLTTTNLPAQVPAGTVGGSGLTYSFNQTGIVGSSGSQNVLTAFSNNNALAVNQALSATFTGTSFPGQNATAFSIVPPSIVVNKIKRAC